MFLFKGRSDGQFVLEVEDQMAHNYQELNGEKGRRDTKESSWEWARLADADLSNFQCMISTDRKVNEDRQSASK